MAKNITLAIDEDLLDKVRVLAAMRRTSVNAMIREFLEHTVESEGGQDVITQELLKLSRESQADFGESLPTRQAMYSERARHDR